MSPAATADYPRTFAEFIKRFDTEDKCLAYVESIRWPDGFVCPFCGVVAEPWRIPMPAVHSKTEASLLIDEIRRGAYRPPEWDEDVPF